MQYFVDIRIYGICPSLKGILACGISRIMSGDEVERLRKVLCEFIRYELISNFFIKMEEA